MRKFTYLAMAAITLASCGQTSNKSSNSNLEASASIKPEAATTSAQGVLGFKNAVFTLTVTHQDQKAETFRINSGIEGRIGFSKMKALADAGKDVIIEGKINAKSHTIALSDIVESSGVLLFENGGFSLKTSQTGIRDLSLDSSRVMFSRAMKARNKLVSVTGTLSKKVIVVSGMNSDSIDSQPN